VFGDLLVKFIGGGEFFAQLSSVGLRNGLVLDAISLLCGKVDPVRVVFLRFSVHRRNLKQFFVFLGPWRREKRDF
jgi:hypothetical protein